MGGINLKLIDLAKKNLEEYISVKDVLELIADTQQTPLSFVATFLISQGFETDIPTYDADRFFVIHSNDSYNWGKFEYTNDILANLADNNEYNDSFIFNEHNSREKLKNTYWKRSELYNLKLIKSLSIDSYFRAQDIRNTVKGIDFSSQGYNEAEILSDDDVRKLLKSSVPNYYPNSAIKHSLIDDFVTSLFNYFDCNFDKGFEISGAELKQIFFDHKIVMKGFNDDLSKDDLTVNKNIWDENYLSLVCESLIQPTEYELNFDINELNLLNFSETTEYPLFYKNDVFTEIEAICLISGDDPEKAQYDRRYIPWRNANPQFLQAERFIGSAILNQIFDEIDEEFHIVQAQELKNYFTKKAIIVEGFNSNIKAQENTLFENATFTQTAPNEQHLQQEIKELRNKIRVQDSDIANLKRQIAIQTSPPNTEAESKLGSARAENNVSKLILILSKMAKVDVLQPYANHASLQSQADLLGVDKFPSNETVKKWFKKASEHIDSPKP